MSVSAGGGSGHTRAGPATPGVDPPCNVRTCVTPRCLDVCWAWSSPVGPSWPGCAGGDPGVTRVEPASTRPGPRSDEQPDDDRLLGAGAQPGPVGDRPRLHRWWAPDPAPAPRRRPGRRRRRTPPAPEIGAGEPFPGASETGLGDPLLPEAGWPGIDVTHYDLTLGLRPGRQPARRHRRHRAAGDPRPGAVRSRRGSGSRDRNGRARRRSGGPRARGRRTGAGGTPRSGHPPTRWSFSWSTTPESSTGPDGLPMGWFATETGSFVLNEPDGLHSWMPANDHPSDKATWSFELTVPAGTNGGGQRRPDRSGRGRRHPSASPGRPPTRSLRTSSSCSPGTTSS